MFPFDIDTEETAEEMDTLPCEYGIDYSTGQLTGRMVYGLEAIKVWIWLYMGVDRYFYEQYSWDNGHELAETIGKDMDSDKAEQTIAEGLKQNPHIKGMKDVQKIKEGEKLTMIFTVVTDLGDIEGVTVSV